MSRKGLAQTWNPMSTLAMPGAGCLSPGKAHNLSHIFRALPTSQALGFVSTSSMNLKRDLEIFGTCSRSPGGEVPGQDLNTGLGNATAYSIRLFLQQLCGDLMRDRERRNKR